jgi:hypothetical protein
MKDGNHGNQGNNDTQKINDKTLVTLVIKATVVMLVTEVVTHVCRSPCKMLIIFVWF